MRIFEKKKYKTCVLCALCTASLLLTALPALPASAAQMEEPFEAAQAQGSDEALQAGFETMAEERPVQATVITPQGAVVTAAEGEEPLCVLPAGSQVLLLSPQDTGDGIRFLVSFGLEDAERYGYLDAGEIVCVDERYAKWLGTVSSRLPYETVTKLSGVKNADIESFPASYQGRLRALKNSHPNWIFVPMNTGLNWNTVVTEEMRGERSLVHASLGDDWKAERTAQSNWYIATESAVKYVLDPRNFLTENHIFMFEQLTYNASYHSPDAVQRIIAPTFMSGLIPDDNRTYAEAFWQVGSSLGVSPFHLACRVYQEQGASGGSPLISGSYGEYQGYYNYFNIKASGKTTAEVIANGLAYAKQQGWDTRYKSIAGGAYFISANYILKGQDTLYLQKFDVDSSYNGVFSHQYMQNITAPMTEGAKIRQAYEQTGSVDNPFVFKVPVYSGMPSSACPKPGAEAQDEEPEEPALTQEQMDLVRDFIIRLYVQALGRDSYTDDELSFWYNALMQQGTTGSQVAYGFFFSPEYIGKKTSNEEYIRTLYRVLMNREADPDGLGYWLEFLDEGVSRKYLFAGFAHSPEFEGICKTYGIRRGEVALTDARDRNTGLARFVYRLYAKLLERDGEEEGMEYWCKQILDGDETMQSVLEGFVFSPEFEAKQTTDEEYIKILYRTFLCREYEEEGLAYWVGLMQDGLSRKEVLAGFADSPEFRDLKESYGLGDK